MKSERETSWRPPGSVRSPRYQTRDAGSGATSFGVSHRSVNDWPLLPWPRGPLSAFVVSALQREPGTLGPTPRLAGVDVLRDDDFGLALYLCYEVHYRNLAEPFWRDDPQLLEFRRELEGIFVEHLHEAIRLATPTDSIGATTALDELIRRSSENSLSVFLSESGTLEHFRELCVHHSAYQLRDADPLAFGMPRHADDTRATAGSVESASSGSTDSPSNLFAATMVALGLDPSYGSYVENLPAVTLALVNLTSMFSLERKWRAALVGHLAVSDMTSSEPMYRYGQALARFGIGPEGRRFYDVKSNINARHTVIARERLVAGLIGAVPHLESDLLFGAAALLVLEENFEKHVLDAWWHGRTSLVPWRSVSW
jgi:hypothetical protein